MLREISELKLVLFPTVMSPVGQLVPQGTFRCISRLPPTPVHVDCWLRLIGPLETMARSAPRLICALFVVVNGHVDRMRTITPLNPAGTPAPPANPDPVPSM